MNKEYVWLCKTLNSKGFLIPREDYLNSTKLANIIGDSKEDWYSSLFFFNEDMKNYFENNNNSVAGYTGKAFTDHLTWDFDSHDNLNKPLEDARSLLNKLGKEGFINHENIRCFYSGSKGFHVYMYLDKPIEHIIAKNICTNLAKDLSTFDAVIYDTTRKFRIPNTAHQKSGLYKIELLPSRLKNITESEIKETAQHKVFLNRTVTPVDTDIMISRYYKEEDKSVIVDEPIATANDLGIRGLNDIDFSKCSKSIPRCVFALSHGIMQPGERNHVMLNIGNYYRNLGLPRELVYHLLKGIAEKNSKLYPEADPISKEELYRTILPRVFKDDIINVDGFGIDPDYELFRKYCNAIESDKACPIHGKHSAKNIISINDVASSFKDFAENFEKNTIKTGIRFIDKYMKISIGTTTLIVASAGVGKTTLALNIIQNSNRLGLHTMFFSLDMHKTLVYLKLAQSTTYYTQDEIINFYKTKNEVKMKEIREAIAKNYDKTFFDFSGTLSVEDMQEKILELEKKKGIKIKFVVVDYAGRITSQYADPYSNANFNALKSKEAADNTNAAWIILSQIGRQSGDGSTPLRTKRAAKESGSWEESASNIITLWRPFMGMEDKDVIIRLFLAKNRLGSELERPLWWDGRKGLITDMTDDEYETYKSEGEEAEKDAYKSRFGGGH